MARAEHDAAGTARPLVPSVDLSRPLGRRGPAAGDPAVAPTARARDLGGPAAGLAAPAPPRAEVPVTPPGRVDLRLPADAAYLSVLRTTTAALAARLDLSVDDVEDLRIAVDEAASLLLAPGSLRPGATGAGTTETGTTETGTIETSSGETGSSATTSSRTSTADDGDDDAHDDGRWAPGGGAVLEASFDLSPGRLVVEVRGPARHLPERGAVAWAVLEALVGEVRTARTPRGSAIRLVHATQDLP